MYKLYVYYINTFIYIDMKNIKTTEANQIIDYMITWLTKKQAKYTYYKIIQVIQEKIIHIFHKGLIHIHVKSFYFQV